MPASFSDMSFLAGDPTFGNRVASALMQTCVNIENEPITTATFPQHVARKGFIFQISNNFSAFKSQFVIACSVDTNCIADATQAGTVVLTVGNASAQAALVTDAHITSAISAAFNTFIAGI